MDRGSFATTFFLHGPLTLMRYDVKISHIKSPLALLSVIPLYQESTLMVTAFSKTLVFERQDQCAGDNIFEGTIEKNPF